MKPEIRILLQCLLTDGFGPARVRSAQTALRDAGLRFTALDTTPLPDLARITGLPPEMLERGRAVRMEAETLLDVMSTRDIGVLAWTDDVWPARLARARGVTAPTLLFTSGNQALLGSRSVAIGGSRDSSRFAVDATESLAAEVVREGRTVVSGGARGTDLAAHLATIRAGGTTIVVVPQGALTYSPPRAIASACADGQALVVSEFPPLLPWSTYAALHRNRTVAGLAEAFIVTESGSSGGTRSAATDAFRMGVTVGALDVPANVRAQSGNDELIERGAIPIPVDAQARVDRDMLLAVIDRPGRPSSNTAQTSFL